MTSKEMRGLASQLRECASVGMPKNEIVFADSDGPLMFAQALEQGAAAMEREIPAGYKLVPIQPTEAMIAAGIDAPEPDGEALERFGKYEAPGKKVEALPLIVDPAYLRLA